MDNTGSLKKLRFKVQKSLEPDEEGTHIVVSETESEHGYGYRRLFKGKYQECIEKKREMESKYVAEG